jgi:hypothetical protein
MGTNVPWDRVKEWAEQRVRSAETALYIDQDEKTTAKLRVRLELLRSLLNLEKTTDDREQS